MKPVPGHGSIVTILGALFSPTAYSTVEEGHLAIIVILLRREHASLEDHIELVLSYLNFSALRIYAVTYQSTPRGRGTQLSTVAHVHRETV
jgi:hypothetical protein